MSDRWSVEIRVWAFFGMRDRVGDEIRRFEVQAYDIKEAMSKSDLIVQGIRCNPAVWQAPIYEIKRLMP